MKNQYYYCMYCLAYIIKKPNIHHKIILDHFMGECLFKEIFKNVMESKLETFYDLGRFLLEMRVLTFVI